MVALLLCQLHELPEGDSRGFDPFQGGRDTILLINSKSNVYGYMNSCPHIPGSPLAWRKDRYLNADRSHIVCHGHGAEFDIASGICILGPCPDQALTRVNLNISEAGEIFLADKQTFITTT